MRDKPDDTDDRPYEEGQDEYVDQRFSEIPTPLKRFVHLRRPFGDDGTRSHRGFRGDGGCHHDRDGSLRKRKLSMN